MRSRTAAGAESLCEGRGRALNVSLRTLLGLRSREFSRRGERGLAKREVSAGGWRSGLSLLPSNGQSSAPTCAGRPAPQLEAGAPHDAL